MYDVSSATLVGHIQKFIAGSKSPQVAQTCESCRYWVEWVMPYSGHCHRHSPNGRDDGANMPHRGTWPLTSSADFCGDYIKRLARFRGGQ